MNDAKLDRLFAAARKETPPAPASGFDHLVLGALRREPAPLPEVSLLDQLGAWFPRLALAAGLVILVSVTTDFTLSWLGVPTLSDGVWQISDQWLLAASRIQL